MTIQSMLEQMTRNAIYAIPFSEGVDIPGLTRLGGQPDVPEGFQWPWFQGKDADGLDYATPLAFLGQFNCRDIWPLDKDHLLPSRGVLSFFYEAERQPWGFVPSHRHSGRVYWFPEEDELQPIEFPVELSEELHLSSVGAILQSMPTFPDFEDLNLPWERFGEYEQAAAAMPVPKMQCIQMLGWPMAIQGSMPASVELVTCGNDMGGSQMPSAESLEQAKATAADRWQMLLQFTPPEAWSQLMFGDCGQIYFWIPKEDLAAHNFDNVWVVLQCG